MKKNSDEKYIQQCFELAREFTGLVSPNPLVGCVIVKDDKVIAQGAHKKAGTDHAELDAIKNAKVSLKGSTLYCNLEPCCHTNKKTPPCAQRIIEEGIKKVVISNLDPNPLVAGNGIKLLRDAGIEVIQGLLQDKGIELNKIFFTNMTKERPYIHLKWAQSLDGKMSTNSGDSKWITNEKSRLNVHRERSQYDAILIGAHTLMNDDPNLTIRLPGKKVRCPYRVILTTKQYKEYKVFNDEFAEKTLLEEGPLVEILERLYERGICSVYVEGGSHTLSTFIEEDLYDEMSIYTAPKILGSGRSINLDAIHKMSESINLKNAKTITFDEDVLTHFRREICLPD